MIKFRANVLGGFQLYAGDRHIDGFPTKKATHLLAYLMLHADRSHSRELLAEVIGGGEFVNDPRKGIRQELWVIRKTLKGGGIDPDRFIESHGEDIAFFRNPGFRLDVDCFQAAVASVKPPIAQKLTLDEVGELERALELYRGDLLPGIYDDWCLYPREALRDLYLITLERLMPHYQQCGDWDAAIGIGKRELDADDLAESVHRKLMRCYYAKGNRAAALRQYDHCKELLRVELDVEPMLETRTLYAQILNEDLSVVPPIGDRQATMSSGATQPATPKLGSPLAHLGEAMADMKAAHDRMAEAIREFDNLNVDLRVTTDQTAKNAH
jgi:DNA-binding SARP family transcriptional activator